MIDYIDNIGCIIVRALMLLHPRNKCIHAQNLMGGRATAPILALPVCLTMLNKHQGLAIALFFSYAKQAGKTHLYAAQLRNPE